MPCPNPSGPPCWRMGGDFLASLGRSMCPACRSSSKGSAAVPGFPGRWAQLPECRACRPIVSAHGGTRDDSGALPARFKAGSRVVQAPGEMAAQRPGERAIRIRIRALRRRRSPGRLITMGSESRRLQVLSERQGWSGRFACGRSVSGPRSATTLGEALRALLLGRHQVFLGLVPPNRLPVRHGNRPSWRFRPVALSILCSVGTVSI